MWLLHVDYTEVLHSAFFQKTKSKLFRENICASAASIFFIAETVTSPSVDLLLVACGVGF